MPAWVYTKEFNEKTRDYFINKKEKSKGPFPELYKAVMNILTWLMISLTK